MKEKVFYGIFIFISFTAAIIAVCGLLVDGPIVWKGIFIYSIISAVSFIVAGFFKKEKVTS